MVSIFLYTTVCKPQYLLPSPRRIYSQLKPLKHYWANLTKYCLECGVLGGLDTKGNFYIAYSHVQLHKIPFDIYLLPSRVGCAVKILSVHPPPHTHTSCAAFPLFSWVMQLCSQICLSCKSSGLPFLRWQLTGYIFLFHSAFEDLTSAPLLPKGRTLVFW